MNRLSLYLGKIAGIKLFIHWTFLLLIAWIVISNFKAGLDINAALRSVGFMLAVFVCVTLHEFGHALTAKHFKFNTKDITLLPIGGIARMDEFPKKPKHELLVAIAGPSVNLIIALALFPFVSAVGISADSSGLHYDSWQSFLASLFYVNISLALFNLVPAFPMDGGRVFRALLSFMMSREKATNIAARVGQLAAAGFVILGLMYNPVLAVIGVFIFIMAHLENEEVKTTSILHGYTVKDVLMKNFTSLDEQASIDDAVKLLLDVQAVDFLVMNGTDVVGTLNRNQIIKAISEKGKDVRVAEVMNTEIKSLSPQTPLENVYHDLRKNQGDLFPVFEGKQLVGVVDLNNILELIMVTGATEKYRIAKMMK